MALPKHALRVIRQWIPPGLREAFNASTGYAIRFDGVYDRWEDAQKAAEGYDEGALLQRLEDAAQAVEDGRAAWEQDGITHETIEPDWPQFACLSRAALATGGRLTVLDFGGAFGSSYHQARRFLNVDLRWHIVEQPALVEIGRRKFQTAELRFHETIEECLAEAAPDVVLLCGTLQYLPDPYGLLEKIAAIGIRYLILDRHPDTMTRELITVQRNPRKIIYSASYPTWLFDPKRIDAALSVAYMKDMGWEGKDPAIRGRGIGANYVGSFWRLGSIT